MNRNTGLWGAIAVGLIGVFGFSVRPAANKSSPEAGSAQTSAAQNSGEIVEPSQQNLQAACRQINNRIAEFIPNGMAPPESCKEDPAKSGGEACAKEHAAKEDVARSCELSGGLPTGERDTSLPPSPTLYTRTFPCCLIA